MEKRTVGYAAIQGFFWMSFAVILGYASMYLLDAGFDNSRVGVLIAAAGLMSAVIQPVVAGYADRPGSMTLKKLLVLVETLALAVSCGLLLARGSMAMTGVCYACCIVLLHTATPLVNALGVATVNSGEKMNFGAARGMGSLGYALAAYLLGLLADRFGAVTVPVSMITAFVLLLAGLLCYGDLPDTRKVTEKPVKQGSFLARYPRYGVVLVGCVLIFVSHVVLNSFTYQIVVAKGGGSGEMGFAMAFASAIELPIMFGFGWMLKKAGSIFWFRVSGIFFFLKTLGTLLCTNIASFYAVQLFQMGGWALITVSAVFYINSIMAPEDTVKGQTWFNVSITLGNVLGATLAGRILDESGVNGMLIFGSVCSAIGAAIVLVSASGGRKE